MYGCPVPNKNDRPEIPIIVDIKQHDGRVDFEFSADCGSFGTNESLCGYSLTPERLLYILRNGGVFSDDEII